MVYDLPWQHFDKHWPSSSNCMAFDSCHILFQADHHGMNQKLWSFWVLCNALDGNGHLRIFLRLWSLLLCSLIFGNKFQLLFTCANNVAESFLLFLVCLFQHLRWFRRLHWLINSRFGFLGFQYLGDPRWKFLWYQAWDKVQYLVEIALVDFKYLGYCG